MLRRSFFINQECRWRFLGWLLIKFRKMQNIRNTRKIKQNREMLQFVACKIGTEKKIMLAK